MTRKEMSIKEYLKEREAESRKIQRYIRSLRGLRDLAIKVITEPYSKPFFYCSDYSLANFVEIKDNETNIGSYSDPDGGCRHTKTLYFPKFYYDVSRKSLRIHLSEKTFNPDFNEAVFLEIERQEGYGRHHSEDSRPPRISHPNKIEDIAQKYTALGVSEEVLKSFQRKARSFLGRIIC